VVSLLAAPKAGSIEPIELHTGLCFAAD